MRRQWSSSAWNRLAAALAESAPDAVIAVDRRGVICFANAESERVFGYARHEMLGRPLDMLIPEQSRAAHVAHLARYLTSPRPRPMGASSQLAAQRSDGSTFPADISLAPLDTPGGLIVAAIVRDVSERVAMEAERERLRELAERERQERRVQQAQRLESLGQLASGIAHDFGNLLAVILTYSSLVGEKLAAAAAADPTEQWQTLGREVAQINLAAQMGKRLTHQLLAFARQEAVASEMVDLNRVILDVQQLLRESIGASVRLTTALAQGLHPILADIGQIEQVLVNLAVNGRDAMRDGGTLTIQTENFIVDDAYAALDLKLHAGAHVLLRVTDNGGGMPRDVLEHAFEPFFTTKPRGQGSGLGLATVHEIVLQWGGQAWLHSEPGLGTSFAACIPSTEEHRKQSEGILEDPPRGGGETVLLAGGEEPLREIARRMLEGHGYGVLVASSARQALEVASASAAIIQVLLTDVVMPDTPGRELVERVWALRPGVRTIFLSWYPRETLDQKGWLAAGAELLQKPFSESTLLTVIRRVLDAGGE